MWANVVAARHLGTGELRLQMWTTLFGLPSSVIQFGRWSHFLQAVAALMWSMYVDDGLLVDAATAKCEGQELAAVIFAAQVNVFLGAAHNIAATAHGGGGGGVFWVREELQQKTEAAKTSLRQPRRPRWWECLASPCRRRRTG